MFTPAPTTYSSFSHFVINIGYEFLYELSICLYIYVYLLLDISINIIVVVINVTSLDQTLTCYHIFGVLSVMLEVTKIDTLSSTKIVH